MADETQEAEKLRWLQPSRHLSIYISDPEHCAGYMIEKVDDKLWEATYKGEVITGSPETRMQAVALCNDHFNPAPEKLTKVQFRVLSFILEQENATCEINDVLRDSGIEPATAMPAINYLRRRQLLNIMGEQVKVSPQGKLATEHYSPVRRTKKHDGGTIRRFGNRPDWAKEVTEVDWYTQKVRCAEEAEKLNILRRYIAPWSADIADELDKSRLRLANERKRLEIALERATAAEAEGLVRPLYRTNFPIQIPEN